MNPGGVTAWKWGKDAKVLSDPVEGYDKVTPAKIIAGLASMVDELGFPHPVHLHCNNLGAPGNIATTPASPWWRSALRPKKRSTKS